MIDCAYDRFIIKSVKDLFEVYRNTDTWIGSKSYIENHLKWELYIIYPLQLIRIYCEVWKICEQSGLWNPRSTDPDLQPLPTIIS